MKLILTSNGFENKRISEKFIEFLRVGVAEAKVLFVPTAAIDDDAKAVLPKCFSEILDTGVVSENITIYDCDKSLTDEEVSKYDALYFAGGSTSYLYKRICAIGFDKTIKSALKGGAVYVGASAGSIVACKPYLALVKRRIWAHAQKPNKGSRLPKIAPIKVMDFQALIVEDKKLELFM